MDEAQKAALVVAASQCDHIEAAIRNIRDALERASGEHLDKVVRCEKSVALLSEVLKEVKWLIEEAQQS